MSTSAVYELFEWGIAVVLAPDLAEAYNGRQGDVWDAHKDMAPALSGGVVSLALAAARTRLRPPARGVPAPPAGRPLTDPTTP